MARVTIEDCVASIANRFRLVMCSAQRGRELASGVEPTVERDRLIKQEKNAVIALREITQGNLDVEALEDSIVRNHRRFSPIEAATEEDAEGGGARLSAGGGAGIAGDSAEVLPEIHAEAVFGAASIGEAASADGNEAASADGSEAASADGSEAASADDNEVASADGNEAASDEGSEVASDEGSEVAPSDDKVADEEGG